MIPSLIILAALVIVGTALYIHHRLTGGDAADTQKAEDSADAGDDTQAEASVCCGLHAVCEKGLRTEADPALDYYDDDELDVYAGQSADSYADEDVERFRNVMLTLLPKDAAPWYAALQRRGIAFPDALRDELMLIIAEQPE